MARRFFAALAPRAPLRSLRRSPGLFIVGSVTMGLGIGAAVVAFAVAEPVLFREPPYGDSDELVLVGLVFGLVGSLAFGRLLSGHLFNTAPDDPGTFLAVSLVFLGAAAAADYIPARRALRVDPTRALRDE